MFSFVIFELCSGRFPNDFGQFTILSLPLYLVSIDGSQALKLGQILGGSQALN
jgi:hypothetical protein